MAEDEGAGARLIPCARARHGFAAQSGVELGFSAGVSIRLIRRIDDNWLEGELEGKVGIFPASYVDIELSIPSEASENALAKSGRPYAIGLFGFSGDCGGDLPFAKGELIELLDSASSGWMRGRTGKGEGIFPASFVEILKLPVAPDGGDDPSSPSPPASPVYANVGDRVSPSRSPEYALPGQTPQRGLQRLEDAGREMEHLVIENGLSEEEAQPVPVLRRKSETRGSSSPLKGGSGGGGGVRDGEGKVGGLAVPTPTRTPPAPPLEADTPTTTRQPYLSSTLPRPKPRRMKRSSSLSAVQQQINTLQAGLKIERTLLRSARTLLQVSQDEVKREKLKLSIATHETNVKSLKHQIRELKAERETVSEESSHTPPPLRPPSPPHQQLPPPKPPSMKQQRAKVVNELVTTEGDYHSQMHVCCEKLIPAIQEIPEINSEILFANLHEVTCVSRDLLAALQEACRDEEGVGTVFVKFGPRLRNSYAVYCRSHDTASSLLEKYMENPELMRRIKTCLDRVRAETQAWDLQSLLIKPVQRILKYPLLLEKLIETTGDGHPDYKAVHQAGKVIGQVAQDINEIKRRKDLVERYTVGKEDRRGTVSVHSLQKKVRRFQQTLTQLTGLRSKTVDPKFDELEQKVTSLEMLLRQLIRDVTTWQEDLQKVVDCREVLCEGMSLYVTSDLWTLTSYHGGMADLQQAVKTHGVAVNAHVLDPFQSLLALFQDPLHLISKRRDKLLDFDHLQYALDHNTEEPDKIKQLRDACTMAKRNYEALNEQLIEELPHFIQLALNMIHHTLTVLVQLQFKFHTGVHTVLERLADTASVTAEEDGGSRPPLQSSELQEMHYKALAEVTVRLIPLSIVPTSLAMNYTVPGTIRAGGRKGSESAESPAFSEGEGEVAVNMSDSILSSLSSELDMDSSIVEEPPSPPLQESELTGPPLQESELTGPLLQGSELEVVYDFKAQDKAELSVSAGHTVILRCPHDRIGCTEWWLIESQHGTGYVPASFLEYHGNTYT